VEYTLRPEAVWHDKTPITPDDIVFSFKTIMEQGHPHYRAYYRDVKDAVKTAENKVRFVFAHGENPELPLIVGQFPIISKAYYETNEFDKTALEPPLASGPYKISKVEAGQYIVYERVKDYWAENLAVNKGKHNFDTIRFDYYRDRIVASEAFKAGSYDFHQENTAKFWATSYKDLQALKDGELIKREIKHKIPTGMQAFVFNTRREKFNDVRVRKALNYAFDFEWTNKNIFYGAYTRTNSYFSNSVFASEGLPSPAELELLEPLREKLPESVFTTEFSLPVQNTMQDKRGNLRTADRLLKEAGYEVVETKRMLKDGTTPFTIEFLIVSPAFDRVIAPLVNNLKRLGIESNIRLVDSTQYEQRLKTFDFDMTVTVYGQSNAPGNEQINYWHSTKANVDGSRNYIGITNEAVDAMIEHVVQADTKDELVTATRALDRVLLWNYYVIPNWHIQSFRILYWNKFGYPETVPDYDIGINTWWIKE
ncbi:MAG: extracellular solute-binding protein, partial [Rickettsiales bacterium]|nr:extracellular solute-binding protein [Rickettsiales bacterium]